MRIYAIGDIHGQSEKLARAHALIAADRARHDDATAPVIHIGDLPDRGPDTRGVIDRLMTGIAAGEPWVVLKGNHDRMMEYFLRDPSEQDQRLREDLDWLHPRLGGRESLEAYGVDVSLDRPVEDIWREGRAKVPEAHRAFLAGLPTSFDAGDLFFVHAGIRPGVPFDRQEEDDLVWIRDIFLNDERDHGKLVVHGHTVVEQVEHLGNRVGIDTGAGYGFPLSAVVFEGRDLWLLSEDGRERVEPV